MVAHVKTNRGMTLIEALVVMGLSTVVFGLIMNTLIATHRESDRLASSEQLHQEALLISQKVERILRYRIAPDDLEGVLAGGAGPDTAGGGGSVATSNTLPASIAGISSNTLQATPPATMTLAEKSPKAVDTPPSDRLSPTGRSEFTSAPASIQNILGTTTSAVQVPAQPVAATSPSLAPTSGTITTRSDKPNPSVASQAIASTEPTTNNNKAEQSVVAKLNRRAVNGAERFSSDEVVVYSLGSGPDPSRMVASLRNSRGIGQQPSQAYLELTPAGGAFGPDARRHSLGTNPDKFQSQVSFRFATGFNGTDAKWTRESREVPRLVEYTVRVWPKGVQDSAEDDQQTFARSVFQLTSAVALP